MTNRAPPPIPNNPALQLTAQFTELQPLSSREQDNYKGRRTPENTYSSPGVLWPRGLKASGRHARPISASNHAQRNLWRSGEPIIFNSGTVASGPRRDFGTSGVKRRLELHETSDGGTPPHAMLRMTVGQKSVHAESATVTSIDEQTNRTVGTRTAPRRPKQGDTLLRISQISKDADECFSQLQAELQKLKLEKRKRPTTELRQALDVVMDISERAQMLFKTAGRTSEILARNLGKQIAEDVQNIPEQTPVPVFPDLCVTEETTSDVGPNPATTVSEDCAVEVKAEANEPPYAPMTSFSIPKRVMDAKLALADDDPKKYWAHSLYTNSKGKGVDIHYCKTIEESERALQQFMYERVVGFDMEWIFPQRSKTSIRQNVAFVQVASESAVALIHIAQMGLNDYGKLVNPNMKDDVTTLIPPTLRKLVESNQILKIGVNAIGDHRRLRDFIDVRPRGVFELSDLHNLVSSVENNVTKIPRRLVSLARQTLEHLGLPLDKGPVRGSDWSKPISEEQIIYAAADAYAGLRIFDILEVRRTKLNPRPPLPVCRDIENPADDYTPSLNATSTPAEAKTTKKATTVESEIGEHISSTIVSVSTSEIFSTQIEMAGEWVANYKLSLSDGAPQLSNPQLRAYSLWHVAELDVADICKIWRDPPLKESTLALYILDALRIEKLPCDMERAKAVYKHVPYIIKDKYKGWWAD